MTYGANSDKCPVCRHKQQQYLTNRKANTEIMQQWVKCPESGCALRCPLTDFMQHSHGIKLYGVTPQLDRLRRPRPDPVTPLLSSSLVMLPTLRGARHPVTQVLDTLTLSIPISYGSVCCTARPIVHPNSNSLFV